MTFSLFLIALGLGGLILGGEMLLRGAVSVARSFGLSPMVIGLTLVGFGTSTPELVTSLQAAWAGSPGIAVGNVVGSNIGNILLILGIAALIAPIAVDPAGFRRDGTVLMAVAVLCVGVVLAGNLGRVAGALLVGTLLAYLIGTLWAEKRRAAAAPVYKAEADSAAALPLAWPAALLIAVVGLVVTIIAARVLVTGAVDVARTLGLSEAVIGLTIVAIGTSMPELVATVIAMRKGQGAVALGNVIGSNIFNVLGILGVTALVAPLEVPPAIIARDIWVMMGATLLLTVLAVTGWRISRREGGVMLALYGAYVGGLLV